MSIQESVRSSAARGDYEEQRRSLPEGSPLGIRYPTNNHCYIVASLQCLANGLGRHYAGYQPAVEQAIITYCQAQERRRLGEEAVVEVDTDPIEGMLPYQGMAEQGEVSEVVRGAFQDPGKCYYMAVDSPGALMASCDAIVGNPDVLLVQTQEHFSLPKEFERGGRQYALTGVITHTGKPNRWGGRDRGHYVVYLHQEGKYFFCTGVFVKEVSKEEVQQAIAQGPALRFYVRTKTLDEMTEEMVHKVSELGADGGLLLTIIRGYAEAHRLSQDTYQALHHRVTQIFI